MPQLRDSILVQSNAIDFEALQMLASYASIAERSDSLVSDFESDASGGDVEWTINKRVRDTQDVALDGTMTRRVHSVIESCVQNHINPFFAAIVRDWEPAQILRYGPGGHYIPHVDAETLFTDDIGIELWEKTLDRDLSIVIFLNDDFNGGELVFPALEVCVQPSAGTLVCFPSDHNFVHGVNPVTSGERFTLVTWLRVLNMPSVDEINQANMEAYERMWPKQPEQQPRLCKGGNRT